MRKTKSKLRSEFVLELMIVTERFSFVLFMLFHG